MNVPLQKQGVTEFMYIQEQRLDRTVNLVSTIIYVDQYNEKDDAWDQIDAWSKDAENDYFVSTSKYIQCGSGILLPGTSRAFRRYGVSI